MKNTVRIVGVAKEIDALRHSIENEVKGARLVKGYPEANSFLVDWEAGMDDFDLLFLDVEMFPLIGMELIREKKKVSSRLVFDIVFLTASMDFDAASVRQHGIECIQKPLIVGELHRCIENWKRRKSTVVSPACSEFPKQVLVQNQKVCDHLAIPTIEGYEIIEIGQIIRCEADRNYSYIYVLRGRQPYLVSKNLKDLEKALCLNGFLRIHHSHLINPLCIKRILRADGGMIEMIDDTKIRITRNKSSVVERLFVNITKI
ncbi:LytR/AlgR family response regulator transcription factor [Cyclobacterium xiamenense]|uniref:LytR/AlgR family response regulator transcription factor n=1 Tax=Cyclobacterium xiamenense TaxID=1297121 RepID=UPI0012B999B2|nr:LytTR family DNA-binding domain-containing protein [Cyclobacterium xiamenense]